MICDKLTNYENYKGINERVYRALEHAAHNDFSKSVAGRNDVDGDDQHQQNGGDNRPDFDTLMFRFHVAVTFYWMVKQKRAP